MNKEAPSNTPIHRRHLCNPPTEAFLNLLDRYSHKQWLEVQDNCWFVTKRDINFALGTDNGGYFIKNPYIDYEAQQDLYLIQEIAKAVAYCGQKRNGVFLPLWQRSVFDTMRLNNLTRPFLVYQVMLVSAATATEVQIKDCTQNKNLQLLSVFIDEKSQPLTLNKLYDLTNHPIPPKP